MKKNPSLQLSSPRRRTLLGGAIAGVGGAVVFGSSALFSSPALAAPQVGQAAPDFNIIDTQGKMRRLADMKGSIVVLEWTNADCPFVQKHYGSSNMQTLQKEATAAGVTWLSVISSAPGEQGHVNAAQANDIAARKSASPSAILLDPDGKMGRAYGAMTTPHMYVIDKEGILRYMGGIDSIPTTQVADLAKATPLFRNALQSVIKGQPVAQAVTRPYGCNVKYAS